MILMDGKLLASKKKSEIASKVKSLHRRPGLAVILVGDDPASRVYVNGKRKDCEECGFYSEEYALGADTAQESLLELIDVLNGRADIDGILVQLPLPKGLDERAVLLAISPEKDVDCFHPVNVGRLTTGNPLFLPCTPAGVMALLDEYGVEVRGKHCVVVGRSNIVGKPMSLLLLARDGTVTIAHSKTPDLASVCRSADILVSAVGRAGLISGDMIQEGAVVVDVAVNRMPDGKLRGDIDTESASVKASHFTPVPGGVGPMTRAMLMENTLRAAQMRQG